MIRDIRRNGAQPKDTMHKADVALVTGMGVVIKDASTVKLPGEETAKNIYVATKERIPTGINAARTDMSDYDEDFVNIVKGEFLGLERYTDGEKFATDQFKADDFSGEVADGTAVSVVQMVNGRKQLQVQFHLNSYMKKILTTMDISLL